MGKQWTVAQVMSWQRFGLDDFPNISDALSGVYVLFCQPDPAETLGVIYVGRSIHIRRRVANHNQTMPIDEVAVLPIPDKRQQELIESQLIYDLQPPLNVSYRVVRPVV